MWARAWAWLGGATFVISLAVCAWWFVVRFGPSTPFTGVPAIGFDAVLVTVFASHHSIFARDPVKAWLTIVPPHLMRSVYVWTASLLLIAVCVWWRPVGGDVYDVGGPLAVALAIVQWAGLALIARSVAGLDPLELAGIRQAGGAPPRHEALQITGPYRLVRHPLYLGWVLALFGAAHMTGDRLAFAVLTSAYLVIAVPWEERSLTKSFGDEYTRYTRLVRWRIVPFVY